MTGWSSAAWRSADRNTPRASLGPVDFHKVACIKELIATAQMTPLRNRRKIPLADLQRFPWQSGVCEDCSKTMYTNSIVTLLFWKMLPDIFYFQSGKRTFSKWSVFMHYSREAVLTRFYHEIHEDQWRWRSITISLMSIFFSASLRYRPPSK